jgi:hypothetical protein
VKAGRTNRREKERKSWRDRARKNARRNEAGDYRPRHRLVYGSADAHHLLKKTCCSKCVHFACVPVCADQLAQQNCRSYLIPLLRFDQVKRRSALSHFSTNAMSVEGKSRLAIQLTCCRDYSRTTNFVSSELHDCATEIHVAVADEEYLFLFQHKLCDLNMLVTMDRWIEHIQLSSQKLLKNN